MYRRLWEPGEGTLGVKGGADPCYESCEKGKNYLDKEEREG